MRVNLDQLWLQVFGQYESVARIVIGFAAFAAILLFLTRPGKGHYLSLEEEKKQRTFRWIMITITVLFSVIVWRFVGPR
jgi:succinate dehydrogenase/fumarate reductase cytochrome b subunit